MVLEQRWNSLDALTHIEAFVLLLDHFLPPTTGREVLETLMVADVPRPATVVAMSSEAGMNEAMVRLGADVGVVKFELANLSVWDSFRRS